VFQSIGFIRWIFVMPYLTQTYFEQPAAQQTVSMLYEMLNRYAGESIGEHLGFITMGFWTIVLGVLITSVNGFKKWLGYTGVLTGALIIVSVAEHFGGRYAPVFGSINFVANGIWSIWLMVLAIQIKIGKGFTVIDISGSQKHNPVIS
ncbi:MAG: DUF4386 domain-containing protein, partial [Flavobacterium sp.]|nr:DUF4386 domain-containing protein [Flavobacterium sp.]